MLGSLGSITDRVTDGPSAARDLLSSGTGRSLAVSAVLLLALVTFLAVHRRADRGDRKLSDRTQRARGRPLPVTATRHSAGSPVTDRLLVLQFMRLLNLVALFVIPALAGVETRRAIAVALVYLVVVAGIEVLRRAAPSHAVAIVSWSVLIDGLAVVLGVGVTGGYRSPLLFLVFLDVMAVTLVASYRTGLKLAVWCALLLLLLHAAADAGVVEGQNVLDDRVAIVSAIAFLLFAVCAALFSAINERALRNSRGHLEQLVELGAELERAIRPDDVLATLVRHACARLGFTRAVVLVRSGPVWDGVRDDGVAEAFFHVSDQPAPLVDEVWSGGTSMLVRVVDDDLLDLVLPGARNVVITPITADGEQLGVAVGEWGGGNDARIPTSTVRALAQASMHSRARVPQRPPAR